jgi:beta-lactamase superfamily II metal-dependent hydrolase
MRTTCGLIILLAAFALASPGQQNLEVHFLNVDHGDATLIVSPSGRSLLIDAGSNSRGSAVVVPLLRGLKLTSLTYMVATHYHADHIGGLDEVVQAGFRPQVAYDRGTYGNVPNDSTYQGYTNAVSSVRKTITPGTVLDLGSGVTAECFVVNGQIKGGPNVNILGAYYFENAASVGLRIRYRDFQMWVGGDVTGGGSGSPDVETPLARRLGDLDVAQINHHGSNLGSNFAFLYGTSPEVTVISCGHNDAWGHPHLEVLQRLAAFPTVQAIYQTTRGAGNPGGIWANGTIRLRTDGTSTFVVDGGVLTPRTFPVDETGPPPPHPRAPGELVVSEFLADSRTVDDSFGEYVEIRNTTKRRLDLIGLTLRDEATDSFRIKQSVPVDAGGSVIVGRHADPLKNGGVVPDLVVDRFSLADASDQIRLDDPWGTILDVVRYTSSYPLGNGAAAERKNVTGPGTASNFARAITTFGAGDLGTPGNPNAADAGFPAHLAITKGIPLPGRQLTLRVSGPAQRIYVVVLSTTRAVIPLPGNVTLGVGLDLLLLSSVLPGWIGGTGSGVATAGLGIPNAPALRGQTFFLQLVILGGNGWPETASDVVRLVIG